MTAPDDPEHHNPKYKEDPCKKIEQAFREESGMVLRWLTGKLKNADDAQDVLQSVYLRVLAFGKKNKIDNPQALIFKTAANLALNELKRRNRHNARHVAPADNPDHDPILNVQSGLPNSEEALQTRESIQAAAKMFSKLPHNVREAFVLNRIHGKTYREIAVILGVSQSSVEKYMIRALKELKNLQAEEEIKQKTIGESDKPGKPYAMNGVAYVFTGQRGK